MRVLVLVFQIRRLVTVEIVKTVKSISIPVKTSGDPPAVLGETFCLLGHRLPTSSSIAAFKESSEPNFVVACAELAMYAFWLPLVAVCYTGWCTYHSCVKQFPKEYVNLSADTFAPHPRAAGRPTSATAFAFRPTIRCHSCSVSLQSGLAQLDRRCSPTPRLVSFRRSTN